MSLQSINRFALIAALTCFVVGIGSLALSIERPLSESEWTSWTTTGEAPRASFTGVDDPNSRTWDYAAYLAAKSDANLAKGACGFASMNGETCALGGMIAPINWLGLVFLVIGVGAFFRLRRPNDGNGIYA